MLDLLVILLFLYLFSVAVSFGLIKLVFDDIPAKYALYPVFNIVLPFLDLERGRTFRRTGMHAPTTPEQERDREAASQYRGPPPPWRPL